MFLLEATSARPVVGKITRRFMMILPIVWMIAARWIRIVKRASLGLAVATALSLPLVMAPAVAEASWVAPDGTDGWCTSLRGGGTVACFSSPGEACFAQFQSFNPNATYQGVSDYPGYWDTKQCAWSNIWGIPAGTGTGIGAATVYFSCQTVYVSGIGYLWKKAMPGKCEKAGESFPPTCPTCQTDRPIDILSGNKAFKGEDYSTADGALWLSRSFHTTGDGPQGHAVTSTPLGLANWAFDFAFELHIAQDWNTLNMVGVLDPQGGLYKFTRNSSTGAMNPYSNYDESRPQTAYTLALDGTWPGTLSTIRNAKTKWILKDPQDRTWHLETFIDPVSGVYQTARPVTMVERNGRVLTFAYNSYYELASITDSDGKQITFDWIGTTTPIAINAAHLPGGDKINYVYDQISPRGAVADRLIRVEHANSSGTVLDATYYLYGNTSFPTFVTDIQDKNNVTRWSATYDSTGHAVTSFGPGDVDKSTVSYGTNGSTFTRTVTNALGKVTTYNFSRDYVTYYGVKLTSITTAATTNTPATTRSITYGTDKFVATVTDEEGRVTGYTNDSRGRPTQIVEAQGTTSARTTTITWHTTFNVPTQVVAPGLTTTYAYNTAGQLTSKAETDTTTITTPYSTNGRTRTWTYTYTADGQVQTVDGPLSGTGDTVTYAYNTNGFLSSFTDEVGHATTVTSWSDRGLPLTVVDANSVSTTFTYDVQGRPLTATVNPVGSQSQYAFDYTAMGDVAKITLPGGGYLAYTYDSARRLTLVTNDRGQTQTLTKNLMDKPTAITVATSGATTTQQQGFAYDELSRTIQAIGAGSQTWAFAYDKVDNPKSVTDARGKQFQAAFDPLNRAITLTDPETRTIQLAYGANDNLTSHKDGRNLQTTRVVDGFGRTIREVSPDRGTRTYYYDLADHLTEIIDGDSQVTDYAYDAAGRLTSSTYVGHSAETVTYAYDSTASGNMGVGRLTGVTEESGSTGLAYDAQGRIVADAKTIKTKTYTLLYAYDVNGRITGITLPSGRTVSYARASDGLVTGITTKATPTSSVDTLASSVAYRPFGPLQSLTYGNGLSLTRTYDQNYWLTQTQVTATGVTRLDLSFGRNADGQLTSVTDNASSGRGASFGYTDSGRLNAATGPWGADAYTYDAAGNRTDKARTIAGVTTHETPILASTSNRLTQAQNGSGGTVRTFTYRSGGVVSQVVV